MAKTTTISVAEVKKLRKSGESFDSIGRKLKISDNTIRRILAMKGGTYEVRRRKSSTSYKGPTVTISWNELSHLKADGMTRQELANYFKVGTSTINKALKAKKDYEVKLRKSNRAAKGGTDLTVVNKALKATNGLSTKIEALVKALEKHDADGIRIDLKTKKVEIRYSRVEEMEL